MSLDPTLTSHRPHEADLLAHWGARREATLADVLARVAADDRAPRSASTTPPTPWRRWATLSASAAAVAAALVLGPTVLSPGSAEKAAAVQVLVRSATLSSAVVIPEGKYLHLTVVDTQTSTSPGTNAGRRTLESWIGSDGSTWRRDVENDGSIQRYLFPPLSGGTLDFSPSGAAALPTDARALREHLDARVQGSSSPEEAVFVAIGDLTRLGYVPPAVRAAAIEVAAGLPHVTATRDDARVVLTFRDDEIRRGVSQSLVYDVTTAALVAEETTATQDGFRYTSSTTVSELVDALPADVVAGAVAQPNTGK